MLQHQQMSLSLEVWRPSISRSALGPEAGKSERNARPLLRLLVALSCGSCGNGPRCFSKLDVLGACLSGAGLKRWGAQCGLQTLLREKLQLLCSPQTVGLAGDEVYDL